MKTLVYAKISKIINKLYNVTRAYYFNIKKKLNRIIINQKICSAIINFFYFKYERINRGILKAEILNCACIKFQSSIYTIYKKLCREIYFKR